MEYLQYLLYYCQRKRFYLVLNLVISGIPSIPFEETVKELVIDFVLNLVISGIPSILLDNKDQKLTEAKVLNLVISGIPSILDGDKWNLIIMVVLNLVISGIPSIPLILIRILILWLVNSLFRG